MNTTLGCVSIAIIMWSSSIVILVEFGFNFFCDHTFARSFNVVVTRRIVFMWSRRRTWYPQGADQYIIDLCRGHGFLYSETNGLGLGSGHASPGLGRNRCILWLGQIHVRHGVPGCRCGHEFSNGNAWKASTDVPPKADCAGDCAGQNAPASRPVPVLIQCCRWSLIVVGWQLMLRHTQHTRNLAWNEQWSGLMGLCPLPTSSVQPFG